MLINLDDYGAQIKTDTFILFNDETKEGKPLLNMVCNKCNSCIKMNIKTTKKKYLKAEFAYMYNDSVDTIKDLISIEEQTYVYCPMCGFKHDIVNVEVLSKNNNMFGKGINQLDVKDVEFEF